MKYAVIQCANGNFTISSEWSSVEGAIKAYHGLCQALWNDPGTITACVMIVNENFDMLSGYKEYISKATPNE